MPDAVLSSEAAKVTLNFNLTQSESERQAQAGQRMSLSRLLSTGVTSNLSRTMRLRYLLIMDFEAKVGPMQKPPLSREKHVTRVVFSSPSPPKPGENKSGKRLSSASAICC